MTEVLYTFNVIDNVKFFPTRGILFLIGIFLLNTYVWKSKKIGSIKIGLLIMGLIVGLSLFGFLIYDWKTYISHINSYKNGDFSTEKGYVSDIDTRFRASDFFTLNNREFKVTRRAGCYSTLSKENEYFEVNSLLEVKYLDDGCIVGLTIWKN